jgi:multiple sugar transport system ATP-binding protein
LSTIELLNVSKRFQPQRPAVDDLSLLIPDGSFTVLLGPSGCGKTTTLQMIAGLEPLSAGDLLFDSVSVKAVPAHKRDIAMVFQSYALYPQKTVYENMAF